MPITPSVTISNQVQPNGSNPAVNQQTFGQMIGAVSFWNPNAQAQIEVFINDAVREIYDRRMWYGLLVKGQIVAPNVYSTGQATLTFNSNQVTGTGTGWTSDFVGRQIRQGLASPIYTITTVNAATQTLTLDLPWASPMPLGVTTMTTGYYIAQMYYNLGPNIKYVWQCTNLTYGYQMNCNLTQDGINKQDPWRGMVNYPLGLSPIQPDPSGSFQVEMWPAPFTQQAFPFMAYTQPPNLVNDTDALPAYVRSDLVVTLASAKALQFRPRMNPGYSEGAALQLASEKIREFEAGIKYMQMADEALMRTLSTTQMEDYRGQARFGGLYDATHAVMSRDTDW